MTYTPRLRQLADPHWHDLGDGLRLAVTHLDETRATGCATVELHNGRFITADTINCARSRERGEFYDAAVVADRSLTPKRADILAALTELGVWVMKRPADVTLAPKEPAAADEPEMVEPLPFRWASEITAQDIVWLLRQRIPRGMLTALVGDPGVGKSFMLAALATALSLGARLPDTDAMPPAVTLMLSAEDSDEHATKPRLLAMGADCRRIAIVDIRDEFFTLNDANLARLDRLMEAIRPVLVTIDPIMSYIGGKVDSARDNEARGQLNQLRALAVKHDAAVVYLLHMNKASSQPALYRAMSSIAYVAAARSVLLAGNDPDDKSRGAVIQIKTNAGQIADPLGYSLQDGRFAWLAETPLTEARILSSHPVDEAERNALDEAVEVLETILSSGAMDATQAKSDARKAGVAERTLDRAKAKLGLRVFRRGFGREGTWYWELPGERPTIERQDIHRTPTSPYRETLASYGEVGVQSLEASPLSTDDPDAPLAWRDEGDDA